MKKVISIIIVALFISGIGSYFYQRNKISDREQQLFDLNVQLETLEETLKIPVEYIAYNNSGKRDVISNKIIMQYRFLFFYIS